MGHRVMNHKSKCKSLHGHRYKIEVGVNDEVITTKGSSDEGMVLDFGDLKKILVEEIDLEYDHGFIISKEDTQLMKSFGVELVQEFEDNGRFINLNDLEVKIIVVDFIPTAENLAKHWFKILKKRLSKLNIALEFVKVWETPNSTAIWTINNEDERS